jgi:hypothetical protein
LTDGLFLFNHACRTTLACRVAQFQDLYSGPIHRERKTGSPECLGLCRSRGELGTCPTHCECAYVREILAIVQAWPKIRQQS